jgi:hypothetical protein
MMTNDEQELITRLAAVESPPTRLAVDDVVRAGRKRSFRRRAASTAGTLALAVSVLAIPVALKGAGAHPQQQTGAAASPSAVSPSAVSSSASVAACRMTALAVPAGLKDVGAVGVDPTGRYVIGHAMSGQNFIPILWTDGQPQVLPVHGRSVELSSVNAQGVVVGIVTDAVLKEEYVFRYAGGAVTKLKTPRGHWHPYPVPAVNAVGDVIVNVEPSGNSGGEGSIVLLWKAGSTTAQTLPLPKGANAFTITDEGTIVGGTYVDGLGKDAYVWALQGTGRKLTTPAGQSSLAYDSRGDWVTGGYWPSQSIAVWNLRTGEVTTIPDVGPGQKVNSSGWVLASGKVFRNGAQVPLPVADGHKSSASGVSDSGLIVGVETAVTSQADVNLGPRTWQC